MQTESTTQPTTLPQPQFYTWKNYRCAYEVYRPESDETPLLLIHPIGVGLSRNFWHRFCAEWYNNGPTNPIYSPDLLGCGDSDMPRLAYQPEDWAEQLLYFIKTVVKKPVVVVVQGALFPVAIKLVQRETKPPENAASWIKGLALSGPPAWRVITKQRDPLQQKLRWNLFFDTLIGNAFYRYARRRQFLQSFSIKQLFGKAEDVDENWLTMLQEGAKNPASRYAVFSFLAGFWRQNYASDIQNIQQPTLVVFGEQASSISKEGKTESPEERLQDYVKHLPNGEGIKIPGRNVMPYETPTEFIRPIAPFIQRLSN
ncbi:alpha/beta fold hydrolase [Phormidium sp. CCY1219]|uniref:alpha/beta fold hydrolase n=1 Tax=Phormidium sp. CCY1219 TaxID=2886104 RepID=UPI002D1EA1DA|nr:alpha/beta hydrolase [Phormidium sp. CCY1219]MEB3831040.1 alpha/beta hydrolase [Phormidium sp. CCY1219]